MMRNILLVVVLVALMASAAIAQDHPPTAAEADSILAIVDHDGTDDRTTRLVQRIRLTLSDLERYMRQLETASPEDSLVLRLRIEKDRLRVVEDLHELGDVLVGLEKEQPQPLLRQQVEAAYALVTPAFWFHINRLRDEIDDLRAGRPRTEPAKLVTLENRIELLTRQLDDYFGLVVRHLRKIRGLGLDDSTAREQLSNLLTDRADELYGRIDLALLRIDELEARIKNNPDAEGAKDRLIAAHISLNNNTKSAGVTLDLMDEMKLQTVRYREQLVTATRDVGRGLLDRGVAAQLFRRWWRGIKTWFSESGPGFLVKMLLFLGIIYLSFLAGRLSRRAVERSLAASKLNVSRLLHRMIVNSVANLILLFGIMLALAQLGISLGPLLAGVGVAGFIVGFALQDTLANFAAGMMILMYRPYDVGDVVEAGGVFGKVDKMSLVSTTILTFDNQEMVVPNNKIWGDVIKNVTAQSVRRVDMVFGISYGDNIPKAKAILEDILEKHEKVLDDPAYNVRVHTLNESSVDFICRPWVKVEDYWDVYWDVTQEVKMRFDAEGVSIPFPQRDVHFYPETAGRVAAAEIDAPQEHSNMGLADDPDTGKDDDETQS